MKIKLLRDLHKTKLAEYITNGQFRFMFSEIDKQLKGAGTLDNIIVTAKDGATWNSFDYYWTEEHIGNWVNPKLFKYNEPEIL